MGYITSQPSSGRRTKREILDGTAPAKSRMVGHNTAEWIDSCGIRRVRLHRTDILTFYPCGSFEVDTGGWNTHTTRDRLREHLPAGYGVHTHKGQIYLSTPNRRAVPFRRRVMVGPRGAVKPDSGPDNARADRDRRLIDSYMARVKGMGDKLPSPAPGDPFIPPDPATGKYPEHTVREWLREGYVFGSLIVAAGRFAGMGDLGIQITMIERNDATTRRRIRRYVRACLGYEA